MEDFGKTVQLCKLWLSRTRIRILAYTSWRN